MLATFMEVLDTSVANVSLPHIGVGNLSATTDESDLGADQLPGGKTRSFFRRLTGLKISLVENASLVSLHHPLYLRIRFAALPAALASRHCPRPSFKGPLEAPCKPQFPAGGSLTREAPLAKRRGAAMAGKPRHKAVAAPILPAQPLADGLPTISRAALGLTSIFRSG